MADEDNVYPLTSILVELFVLWYYEFPCRLFGLVLEEMLMSDADIL